VPSAARLLLIRHAEIETRYQGIFGGRIDMELSPRGHEQAAALAKYLHRKPLGAIYASPMKRVQQTLAPLLANGAPKPIKEGVNKDEAASIKKKFEDAGAKIQVK
jgi:broad specificity phosphatase PhoE